MEIDRRRFLKLGGAAVIGVVTGMIELPVEREVSKTARDLIGKQEGNAGAMDLMELSCRDAVDEKQCMENYEPPIGLKIIATTVAPALEEFFFRILPSRNEDAMGYFSSGIGLSRRELVIGSFSSIIYGGIHNITTKGFDTRFIPVTQTLGGMLYWYLQRKFGAISNLVAHSMYNLRAMM